MRGAAAGSRAGSPHMPTQADKGAAAPAVLPAAAPERPAAQGAAPAPRAPRPRPAAGPCGHSPAGRRGRCPPDFLQGSRSPSSLFATQTKSGDGAIDFWMISVAGTGAGGPDSAWRGRGGGWAAGRAGRTERARAAAALSAWRGPRQPRASPAPQAPRPRRAPANRPGAGAAAPPRVGRVSARPRDKAARAAGAEREGGGGRRAAREEGTRDTENIFRGERKQLPLSCSGRKSGRKRTPTEAPPGRARGEPPARRERASGWGPTMAGGARAARPRGRRPSGGPAGCRGRGDAPASRRQ